MTRTSTKKTLVKPELLAKSLMTQFRPGYGKLYTYLVSGLMLIATPLMTKFGVDIDSATYWIVVCVIFAAGAYGVWWFSERPGMLAMLERISNSDYNDNDIIGE